MANLDPNVWYQVTESRVDFNSSYQYNGAGLFFASRDTTKDAGQYWQFQPAGDGKWQIRNIASSINQQLSTCFVAKEVDDSKTQPCMSKSTSDDSQLWNIEPWGDNTYRFTNVGNGTGYNMDCHPGNPPFMSSATAALPLQPAQHWLFSSIRDVNDGTYSTTFLPKTTTATGTSTVKTTATGTSGSSSSSTSTPGPTNTGHSGITTGAAIGIGVGVGLAAACFITLLLLLRKRSANARAKQNLAPYSYSEVQGLNDMYSQDSPGTAKYVAQDVQELNATPPPVELPGSHTASELGYSKTIHS